MRERMTTRHAISLLPALCLLLVLTACGKEQTDGRIGRIVYVPQAVDFVSGPDTIDSFERGEPDLAPMVLEPARVCFAGDKSPEEALYVNENR